MSKSFEEFKNELIKRQNEEKNELLKKFEEERAKTNAARKLLNKKKLVIALQNEITDDNTRLATAKLLKSELGEKLDQKEKTFLKAKPISVDQIKLNNRKDLMVPMNTLDAICSKSILFVIFPRSSKSSLT